MQPLTLLTAVEQVAGHLRRELRRGEWSGIMPGVNPLVAELGVNHKTVDAALRMLEDEGLLVNEMVAGYEKPCLGSVCGQGLHRNKIPKMLR